MNNCPRLRFHMLILFTFSLSFCLNLALHLYQMQSYKREKMLKCEKTIYKVFNNSKNQKEDRVWKLARAHLTY